MSHKRKRTLPAKPQQRMVKRKKNDEDLEALNQRVQDLDPNEVATAAFDDLPLSRPTASGLEASHFKSLTEIQQQAIPLALKGSDILGAAKTGSGKTLAFLIPVLENLYRKRWTELDGLGALILSPTRELAIQIFEVLRKIGRYHTFSAGLVIGGKSLQEERERLGRMNILVCTPGRMLQHMDQTATFEIDNLQMLVLDEADRILDMGFQGTVDAIVEHLPKDRQTLLFSATQTKKISDLARLSLRDPEYVSVHEAAKSATPATLQQNYIVTPLPEKLNTLWSFIRANLKSKILVFLSSGKQVRFVYEGFRHMQPGIPLLHLHGRQKQTARLDITTKFSATKTSCLFATDVVARGLDFPSVDWVIQLDCPEDADTYIHRVGRTARYEQNGRAVLFLDRSEEEGMLRRLEQKKVTVEKINIRQKKQQDVKSQLQNMCFKDPELKYLGQKAFISYVKSIHLQKDKEVFKLDQLALEEFSASLGLPGAPKIKFLKGDNAKSLKNTARMAAAESSSDDSGDDADLKKMIKAKPNATKTKFDRMFERQNQDIFSAHYTKLIDNANNDDSSIPKPQPNGENAANAANEDPDFLSVKRRISISPSPTPPPPSTHYPANLLNPTTNPTLPPMTSNRRHRLLTLGTKKNLLKYRPRAHKLVFDADGQAHELYEFQSPEAFHAGGKVEQQREEWLGRERRRLGESEGGDRGVEKEKRRERRERRKRGEREEAGGGGVMLLGVGEREGDWGEDEREEGRRKKRNRRSGNEHDDESKSKHDVSESGGKMPAERLEDLEALAEGLLR